MGLVEHGCVYDYNDYWRAWNRGRSECTEEELAEFGRRSLDELMRLHEPPTAVYCFGPLIATGAAQVAAQRGMQISRDLSIIADVSFEDMTPFSLLLAPHDELAEKLVETALRVADNPHEVHQISVPKQFVDKGSIAQLEPSSNRTVR